MACGPGQEVCTCPPSDVRVGQLVCPEGMTEAEEV